MIIKKKISPVEIENDKPVLNFDASQDCSDWLALGRLRRSAASGDMKAIEKLKNMNTDNVYAIEIAEEQTDTPKTAKKTKQ